MSILKKGDIHQNSSSLLESISRYDSKEELDKSEEITIKEMYQIASLFLQKILGFSDKDITNIIGLSDIAVMGPKNSKTYPWALYVVSPKENDLVEVFHRKIHPYLLSAGNDNRNYCIITNLKELIVCDDNSPLENYHINFLNSKYENEDAKDLSTTLDDFVCKDGLESYKLSLGTKSFVNQFKGNSYNTIIRRNSSKKAEENIKIHIVDKILRQHLSTGYTSRDLSYEHNEKLKRIDIAIMHGQRVKIVVEVKDSSSLSDHVNQALEYAEAKGAEWFILTNGLNWKFYATYIPGIPKIEDRLLFDFHIFDDGERWGHFDDLISRKSIITNFEKNLKLVKSKRRPKVTPEILHAELQYAKEILFNDLKAEFFSKYGSKKAFKQEIDEWALKTKLNIKDKNLIEKLCMEGAYSLINRLLLYRISECQGLLTERLTENCISAWKEAVAAPKKELLAAFEEANNFYSDFFNYPLFNSIKFEDISWNERHIRDILSRFAAFDFSEVEEDIIGSAYEKHLSIDNRKKIGQYYTYDFVVDYMLDGVPIDANLKYIDPACGSGGFLIKLCNRIIDKTGSGEIKPALNALHGCDINPFAVQLTKMNLLIRAMKAKIFKLKIQNVIMGDSLAKGISSVKSVSQKKENIGKKYSKSFKDYMESHHSKTRSLLQENTFDVVLANPPYISLGAWRSAKIDHGYSEDLQDFFSEYYPNSAEYKISTYALFLDLGIQLAKPGGIIEYIIPDSFLAGKYFSKLRKLILTNCDIQEVTMCFEDFWEDAQVGFPVIIKLKKIEASEQKNRQQLMGLQDKYLELSKTVEKYKIQLRDDEDGNESLNKKIAEVDNKIAETLKGVNVTLKECDIPKDFDVKFCETKMAFMQRKFKSAKGDQRKYYNSYNFRFTLFKSKIHEKLYESALNNTYNIKMLVSIQSGICGKGGLDSITSDTKKNSKWHKGISSSGSLAQFHIKSSKEYISLDKPKLVRGYNVDYSSDKIIIPKTGDRIKAAVDRKGLLVSDNLQVVIPRKKYASYIDAIVAIFNSDVFNFLYQTITLEEGRVNAQTDIDTLYSIPIKLPEEAPDIYSELNLKSKEIQATVNLAKSNDSKKLQSAFKAQMKEINELVARLFGVEKKELIEKVEKIVDRAS